MGAMLNDTWNVLNGLSFLRMCATGRLSAEVHQSFRHTVTTVEMTARLSAQPTQRLRVVALRARNTELLLGSLSNIHSPLPVLSPGGCSNEWRSASCILLYDLFILHWQQARPMHTRLVCIHHDYYRLGKATSVRHLLFPARPFGRWPVNLSRRKICQN